MLFASLLLLSTAPSAQAAPISSTWLGGAGSWIDAARWSAGVPQNTASDSFAARVDGGNAVASSVTLDSAASIDSLVIDVGDSLTVSATGVLDFGGTDSQLSGSGVLRLDGGQLTGQSLTNTGATIAGFGEITVAPSLERVFANHGVIDADGAGHELVLTAVGSSDGTLRASNGGTLHISVSGGGFFGSGTVEAVDGSHFLSADSTFWTGANLSALRGSTFELAGSFTASHISADATSSVTLLNNSSLDGDVTLDGHVLTVGTGVSGTITNHGLLEGGLNVSNTTEVVNQGQLALTYLYVNGGDGVTLSGGGLVNFEPGGDRLMGPLHNVDNSLRGVGHLENVVENGGTIEAMGGPLQVSGPALHHTGVLAAGAGATLELDATVTGSGHWLADGGVIHVTGNVDTSGDVEVLRGGTLHVESLMSAGNLVVDDTGKLDVEGVLRIVGDVSLDGANAGRWFFGPAGALQAARDSGAAVGDWDRWQGFEAMGRDLGLVATGFANDNYYLPDLVIGPDGRLFLRDHSDNGNRSASDSEVLYVDTLEFSDSLGLLDLNGIHLYYNHLIGSLSQIIDVPVPEPELDSLAFAALVALTYSRARRRAPRARG